jgi:hypothetical protein
MSTLEERKRRGQEIVKRYRSLGGIDSYASAVDAIADILLYVAQTEGEATQLLQSAEMEFRNEAEGERFLTEG